MKGFALNCFFSFLFRMASPVQRHLGFPVRKSSHKKKTKETAAVSAKFKGEHFVMPAARRSSRNLQKVYTRSQSAVSTSTEKAGSFSASEEASRVRGDIHSVEQVVGTPSGCNDQPQSRNSPTKRKTDVVLSPPTPPKSPTKRKIDVASPLSPPKSPCKFPDSAKVCQPVLQCSSQTSRKMKYPLACGKQVPASTPVKPEEQLSVLTPVKSPHLKSLRSPQKVSSKENESCLAKSPKCPALYHVQLRRPDCHIYQAVKQTLHTANPDQLIGREREVYEIQDFLSGHLQQKSGGSMYISGAPGTGKTATLLHIMDNLKVRQSSKVVYLNCMTVKDAPSICQKLYAELNKTPATSSKITLKSMEKIFMSCKDSVIVVLDEIDQLNSKHQDVLYHMFEWPSLPGSRLILLGVANALDLTDRILPRLQTRQQCRPKLLHFAPYTHKEITEIISGRLSQSMIGGDVVEKSAVQFCARKVAAVAGDMRKALDVCRRAVEMAESEMRSHQVLKVNDCNSPSKQIGAVVKKIEVVHVSRVLMDVYGSSVQAQQSEEVPLQQKLVVCTLLLTIKNGKFKEVSLGKLYETYCKVCRRQQVAQVDQSEFHSLCILLDVRGIIGIKKAKETRLCKITLRQDEKELEDILQDRVLVSTILKEGLPK